MLYGYNYGIKLENLAKSLQRQNEVDWCLPLGTLTPDAKKDKSSASRTHALRVPHHLWGFFVVIICRYSGYSNIYTENFKWLPITV